MIFTDYYERFGPRDMMHSTSDDRAGKPVGI